MPDQDHSYFKEVPPPENLPVGDVDEQIPDKMLPVCSDKENPEHLPAELPPIKPLKKENTEKQPENVQPLKTEKQPENVQPLKIVIDDENKAKIPPLDLRSAEKETVPAAAGEPLDLKTAPKKDTKVKNKVPEETPKPKKKTGLGFLNILKKKGIEIPDKKSGEKHGSSDFMEKLKKRGIN